MQKISFNSLSITEFVKMIEASLGLSFARYGDGAFMCLQGIKGKNCDGASFSQKEAVALLESILDTSIVHGLGTLARRVTKADKWLLDKNIDISWYDCDVMNTASDEGRLYPFIEMIRERKVVFCGPTHLKQLRAFSIQSFVECHPTAAFDEIDALEKEISYRIEKYDADMVILSAGTFASPPLVSRIHKLFPQVSVLDTGSIWDPYVGVMSRSGHKKRGWRHYVHLGDVNFKMDITEW